MPPLRWDVQRKFAAKRYREELEREAKERQENPVPGLVEVEYLKGPLPENPKSLPDGGRGYAFYAGRNHGLKPGDIVSVGDFEFLARVVSTVSVYRGETKRVNRLVRAAEGGTDVPT